MSSTGNVFPGTGANDAGIGATAWTAPGNIVSDNATDATCAAAASSQYLVAKNFGFSIPAGAAIAGITVRVEASEHSGGTESLKATLQDEIGALVGAEKANVISGTAKAIYTYGGLADLWSATLTPAIVNDPDFGVRFHFLTAHDVRVDYVTLAVEYTEPVEALPGLGEAILTGFAAVVVATAHVFLTPGVGAGTLTGFAPTVAVTAHQNVAPGLGEASFVGFAPLVVIGVNVQPGVGALDATGFAPVLAVTNHQTVLPGVGEASFAGFSPVVATPRNVTPGLGEAILTGFASTVATPRTAIPGFGEAVFAGFAPIITTGAGIEVLPGTGQATWTGFAPMVPNNKEIFPGTGVATAMGFAPIAATPRAVSAGVGAALFIGFPPTIYVGGGIAAEVWPGTGVLTYTGYAPELTILAPVRILTPKPVPTLIPRKHDTLTPGPI